MLPHQLPELAVKASNEAKTISMVLKYIALVAVAVCTIVVCALFVKVSLLPDVPYGIHYPSTKNVHKKADSAKVNSNMKNADQNEGVYVVGLNIEFEQQFSEIKPNTSHPKEIIKTNLNDTDNISVKLNQEKQQENNNLKTSQVVETKEPTKIKNVRLPEIGISKNWLKLITNNNKEHSIITSNDNESENSMEPEVEIQLIPFTGSPLKTIFPSLFNTKTSDKKYTKKIIDENESKLVTFNEMKPQEIEIEYTIPFPESSLDAIFPPLFKSETKDQGHSKNNNNVPERFTFYENKPQVEIEFIPFPNSPGETTFFKPLFRTEATTTDKEHNTMKIINESENVDKINEMEMKFQPIQTFQPLFNFNKFDEELERYNPFNIDEVFNRNHENLFDILDKKDSEVSDLPRIDTFLPRFDQFNEQDFFNSPSIIHDDDDDDVFNFAKKFIQPQKNKKKFNSKNIFYQPEKVHATGSNVNVEDSDSKSDEEFNSKVKSISNFYNEAFSNFFDQVF